MILKQGLRQPRSNENCLAVKDGLEFLDLPASAGEYHQHLDVLCGSGAGTKSFEHAGQALY